MKKILLSLLTASMFALPGYAMEEDDGINQMHNNEDIANQQRVVDYERARETAARLFDRKIMLLNTSDLLDVSLICHITDICKVVRFDYEKMFENESDYIANLDDCLQALESDKNLNFYEDSLDRDEYDAITRATPLRYMLYKEPETFAGWVQEAMDHQIKAHGLPDQRFLALHGIYNSETGVYDHVSGSVFTQIYKREYVDFLQDMLDELMPKAIAYLRK